MFVLQSDRYKYDFTINLYDGENFNSAPGSNSIYIHCVHNYDPNGAASGIKGWTYYPDILLGDQFKFIVDTVELISKRRNIIRIKGKGELPMISYDYPTTDKNIASKALFKMDFDLYTKGSFIM